MMKRGAGARWRWLFAIGVIVGLLGWFLFDRARQVEYFDVKPAPPPAAQAVALPVVDAGGRDATALASVLSDRPAFADDVIFLVVASLRGRCDPAHAHELAAMAARARLPVLAGITEALGKDVERREALLTDIRTIATHAPCQGAFDMRVGTFHQRLDPAVYAAAFPDSYFEPDLDAVPEGFGNHTLAERAADDCSRVAYAVLPLDEPRAWQCTALRAAARQHVLALCHQNGERAAPTQSDATARDIRAAVDRLPPTCQ